MHARGVELIIVGLGADGCYASDGRHRAFVPAIATAAEDVTGGGDAAFAHEIGERDLGGGDEPTASLIPTFVIRILKHHRDK